MKAIVKELIDHLSLERIERHLFRGESKDIGSPRVFGGQVLGQALGAALQTVKNRPVHSLHAYFLRAGDINHPIVYEVDRARDGMSFSMRRVIAIQHGRQIFNLSASFQKPEQGLEHQFEMPEVSAPEELMDSRELVGKMGDLFPAALIKFYQLDRPFEFRFAQQDKMLAGTNTLPANQIWFRAVDQLPKDPDLHRSLLAYVSDYHLIRTAILPHNVHQSGKTLQMASLDHAMWFHRSACVDDWLLYATDSPNSCGARGLARGMIFTRAGELVASTAQEGLVRLVEPRN